MSEARTDTTEDLAAAQTAGTGRHRGPAAEDTEAAPYEGPGRGRHRRPVEEPTAG